MKFIAKGALALMVLSPVSVAIAANDTVTVHAATVSYGEVEGYRAGVLYKNNPYYNQYTRGGVKSLLSIMFRVKTSDYRGFVYPEWTTGVSTLEGAFTFEYDPILDSKDIQSIPEKQYEIKCTFTDPDTGKVSTSTQTLDVRKRNLAMPTISKRNFTVNGVLPTALDSATFIAPVTLKYTENGKEKEVELKEEYKPNISLDTDNEIIGNKVEDEVNLPEVSNLYDKLVEETENKTLTSEKFNSLVKPFTEDKEEVIPDSSRDLNVTTVTQVNNGKDYIYSPFDIKNMFDWDMESTILPDLDSFNEKINELLGKDLNSGINSFQYEDAKSGVKYLVTITNDQVNGYFTVALSILNAEDLDAGEKNLVLGTYRLDKIPINYSYEPKLLFRTAEPNEIVVSNDGSGGETDPETPVDPENPTDPEKPVNPEKPEEIETEKPVAPLIPSEDKNAIKDSKNEKQIEYKDKMIEPIKDKKENKSKNKIPRLGENKKYHLCSYWFIYFCNYNCNII